MNDPIKTATTGIALVGEIIRVTGDNPNVKEAGANLGQTALTITKTINNALMPLAAVNYAFDKARKYFQEKFPQDIANKTSSIPADQVAEPKGSIAGPALQGLAFTHEEPNLKEMYLSLLATAMDRRIATEAHPAFVEVIKQLTSEEARLLKDILGSRAVLPVAEFRKAEVGKQGWTVLQRHQLNFRRSTTDKTPVEESHASAMVDNWIRLGLVEVDYSKQLSQADVYEWVEQRPEYARLRSEHETETVKCSYQRGILNCTALGIQFARAVGLA
jgi:hypothetical protein